ncbi:MAG TPA: hypothetical protein VF762_01375 [Blastocatellia bacterium]
MIAILVIIFITLAAGAFTLFGLRHALAGKHQERVLPPPDARGLFSDPSPENDAGRSLNEKSVNASTLEAELIKRARKGDASALSDAHAALPGASYGEVLDALVEHASGHQGSLSALVNHVAKSDELRATIGLANKALAIWKAAPDRRSTSEALHIAALSDDAATYQRAVEEVLAFWQDGRLTGISAGELLTLVESEYWVLASDARLGGAGFALKRTLADVRRKLAAATPAR